MGYKNRKNQEEINNIAKNLEDFKKNKKEDLLE